MENLEIVETSEEESVPQELQELQEKGAILVGLAENFGKELPEKLGALWLQMLDSVSVETLSKAAMRVMETYEFKTLPPFAVLKNAIDEVDGVSKQDVAISAKRAWEKLLTDLSRYGFYNEPKHDPVTERALTMMGGWATACRWPDSEIQFHRKAFMEYYESVLNYQVKQGLHGISQVDAISILSRVDKRGRLGQFGQLGQLAQ
ncbi:MAG: hypothetical protein R3Y11_08540 [Pseudomonadota bacterium]